MLMDLHAVQHFLHGMEIDISKCSCSAKLPALCRRIVIRKVEGGRDLDDECGGRCGSATSKP